MDCYWYINSWRQPPLMGKLSLIHQERCFKLIFVSINGSKVFRMRQIWTRCHLYSGKISCTCWHCKLGTFVNKITIVWDNSCNLCCHTIGRLKYFLFLSSTVFIHSGGCFPLVLTNVTSQNIFVRLISTWSYRRSFLWEKFSNSPPTFICS